MWKRVRQSINRGRDFHLRTSADPDDDVPSKFAQAVKAVAVKMAINERGSMGSHAVDPPDARPSNSNTFVFLV